MSSCVDVQEAFSLGSCIEFLYSFLGDFSFFLPESPYEKFEHLQKLEIEAVAPDTSDMSVTF